MKAQWFFCGWVASTFFTTIFFAHSASARSTPLRYRFVEGQTNVYSVQIETRGESGRETLTGNIFLSAQEVSSNAFRLNLRGALAPRRESGGALYAIGPMRMPMVYSLNESTEIQIDERGRILRMGADIPLPIPLGQLTRVLFELLPEKETASRWEIDDNTFVLDEPMNVGPVDAYLGSRYGVPFFGPRQGPELLAVQRKVKFSVEEKSGDLVNIHKELRLESPLRVGADPRCAASGEGTLIFDTVNGSFRQIDFESKSLANTENALRKTSCSLHVRLLEGEELQTALNPPPPSPPVARTLNAQELQTVLSDLKSDDTAKKHLAATKLNGAKVPELSSATLDLLAPLLTDSDSWMRQSAASFISANANKEAVPYLIRLLSDSDFSIRQSAVKGLAKTKDARAAGPLAEIVARGQSDVQDACNALQNIGPEAEPAVLDLLKGKNVETQRRACSILGQIGTAKSIEPLKDLLLDPDRSLSQAAADAVRAIQARQ